MRQSRKQLGEDSFSTAPGTLEAGRISWRLASRGICPGPSWMRLPDRTGRVGNPVVLLSHWRVGFGFSSVQGGPLLSEMNVVQHIST